MNAVISIFALIVIGIITQFVVSWAGSVLHSIGTEETKYAVFTFRNDQHNPMTTNILMNICIPNVNMVFVFMISKTYNLYYMNKYLIICVFSFYIWRMIWICIFLRRKELYNGIYEFGMAAVGIALAYFLIHFFFATEKTVFISASELREELWFAIIIVLYKFIKLILDKKVKQDNILTQGQITNYIRRKFESFYKKFDHLLEIDINNRYMCIFLYAVMIFEDYNRGPMWRSIERFMLKTGIKKKATLGIMQIRTQKDITDEESVIEFYKRLENKRIDWNKNFNDIEILINDLAWEYNNDSSYVISVEYIYRRLYDYIDEVPRLRCDFHLRDEFE